MNIFILDKDPIVAASYLCNKHIIKMALETAQLLCAAFPKEIETPYRKTHINHPCSIWTRKSISNFNWLIEHGLAICKEYNKRYKKEHASKKIIEWCKNNKPNLSNIGLTEFMVCVPEIHKVKDVVESYRNYYLNDKKYFAKWTNSNPPFWWK